MKKILLVIASHDYQPMEYGEPKRILEQAGYEIVTVSDQPGIAQSTYDDSNVKIDLELKNLSIETGDALFLIGGSGALDCLDKEETYKILQNWQASGKPYGAICISPRILARAGVLKNKKATGWDGDGKLVKIFKENNVEYTKESKESVVVDGNVVTADGPNSARKFGEKIMELLTNYTAN